MNVINFIDEKIYGIISMLQTEKVTTAMMIMSHLGSAIALIILVIAVFIIIKNKKYPTLILLNLATVFLLNNLLKIIVRRSRPSMLAFIQENGYSFPSGHAMVSTAFYGFLIYLTYKNINNKKIKILIISVLIILIFNIGISRIYLGVHYATDVLGGFIIGVIYLMFFIKYVTKIQTEKEQNIDI